MYGWKAEQLAAGAIDAAENIPEHKAVSEYWLPRLASEVLAGLRHPDPWCTSTPEYDDVLGFIEQGIKQGVVAALLNLEGKVRRQQ